MTFRELVLKNRSYRRFDQTVAIPMATLEELIEYARATPSAANRQPLRYHLINDPECCAQIFPLLAWAAYLPEWPGPADGQRPTAYIVLSIDTDICKDWWCDDGIAAQTILLGAVENGLGGCMIGAFKHEALKALLQIADNLKPRLVLALGKPAEKISIDPVAADGSIKYWRDAKGVHHVPKRGLGVLIAGRREPKSRKP